jgi:hypothetical protein
LQANLEEATDLIERALARVGALDSSIDANEAESVHKDVPLAAIEEASKLIGRDLEKAQGLAQVPQPDLARPS